MLNTEEKEIDGIPFRVQQLGAMAGLKLFTRLSRTFAPAMAKALGASAGAKVDLGNLNVGALSDALKLLFETCNETEIESLVKALLSTTWVEQNGAWVETTKVLELVLAGKLPTMIKMCWFSAQVNFGNFTEGLRAFLPQPQTKTQSP